MLIWSHVLSISSSLNSSEIITYLLKMLSFLWHIPDRFGIHPQNDAIGDERFPGGMVGNQFFYWMCRYIVYFKKYFRGMVNYRGCSLEYGYKQIYCFIIIGNSACIYLILIFCTQCLFIMSMFMWYCWLRYCKQRKNQLPGFGKRDNDKIIGGVIFLPCSTVNDNQNNLVLLLCLLQLLRGHNPCSSWFPWLCWHPAQVCRQQW